MFDKITSRSVIGAYLALLEADSGAGWLDQVSNYFPSNQAVEEYAWLGMPPAMREWLGQRRAEKLLEGNFEIRNVKYESTMDIDLDDMRRDKFSQIETRVAEHVGRAQSHFASLVSTMILNLESTVSYDGQYFFDTDHVVGKESAQSNITTVDISTLPTEVAGTITVPSPEQAIQSVYAGIETIVGLKDDQNEPMNEGANKFLVMAPLGMARAIKSGLVTPRGTGLAEQESDKEISVVTNTRLSPWTSKFAVFRTDAPVKALVRQEEGGIRTTALAEGSDYEHTNDRHQYGLSASRGVGPGRWEYATQVVLI